MDKGLLLVGSQNKTHVFMQQNDGIGFVDVETLVLDQSYDSYQLSGRTLVVVDQSDVISMDIAECTHPVPTQVPSASGAPTSCYPVEVQFVTENLGYIQVINGNYPWWEATVQTDDSTVKNYADTFANHDDRRRLAAWTVQGVDLDMNDSLCLGPGRYQFVFAVDAKDNDNFNIYYSVKSGGGIIAQEQVLGEVAKEKVVVFDIPFNPTLINSPSDKPSRSPSTTPSPTTMLPTMETRLTPFPTSPRPQTAFPSEAPDPSKPVARPDRVNLSGFDELFVSVLNNDTPAVGQTLILTSITSQASTGICSISLDLLKVVYIPDDTTLTTDTCEYEACDGVSNCDTATLTFVVAENK